MLQFIKDKLKRHAELPILERCWEFVVDFLSWLHAVLSRYLTIAFTWLWRRQGNTPLRLRFSVGFFLLALGSLGIALMLPLHLPNASGFLRTLSDKWPSLFFSWNAWPENNPEFLRYIENAGETGVGTALAVFALVSCLFALVAAGMAWKRCKVSLWLFKVAWALHAVILVVFARWCWVIPKIINAADYRTFDDFCCKEIWISVIFATPLALIVPILVLVALLTIEAREEYHGDVEGVRVVSNPLIRSLKTGGEDPRMRSSFYWAAGLFIFVIVAPFIFHGCWWEQYGIVKGQGEPEVQQEVRVKPKPKKKQKKLMVDPWSPYILERINIDDAKVMDELEEMTQDVYQANRTKGGKLGKGGKGQGGWPKGMEGAKVRFIRLKYGGGNWDQEMGKSGDYNLLVRFNQMTGLPVANETESREISRLAHFAKKKSPPFVYMTGSGNVNISSAEAKILRDYCEKEGGMLFIDCGGGNFGPSVRNMLRKVFPGKSLLDIPNDDPIYQLPFVFPDGAPRLWHHDGNRALGIRHEGRIMVYYHPGDVKDCWKDGHSGAAPEVAEQAYKLGVNVIYYAFTQYYNKWYDQGGDD